MIFLTDGQVRRLLCAISQTSGNPVLSRQVTTLWERTARPHLRTIMVSPSCTTPTPLLLHFFSSNRVTGEAPMPPFNLGMPSFQPSRLFVCFSFFPVSARYCDVRVAERA